MNMSLEDSSEDERHLLLDHQFRQEIEDIFRSVSSIKSKIVQDDVQDNRSKEQFAPSMEQIATDTWNKFSSKHRTSPFCVNNNIKSASRTGVKLHQTTNNKAQSSQFLTNKGAENVSNKFRQRYAKEGGDHLILKCVLHVTFQFLKLVYKLIKIVGIVILVLFCFYCIFILHKPTQRFISRNTQDLIYPLMRALRLMSIPVVEMFPILTGIITSLDNLCTTNGF